jgi:hypothetical protein
MSDLVTRLRARVPTAGHMARMGSTSMLIHPDGPEAADRIEALEKALEPFARMGWLLDGPFDTALFRDDQAVGLGGAWRENGETRTITFGDLRLAATLLNKDTPNNVG